MLDGIGAGAAEWGGWVFRVDELHPIFLHKLT